MSKPNNNPTVFLDTIGRTIIGVVTAETDDVLSVQNPAIIIVQPHPENGQIQLQTLPLFFKEFQADRNAPTTWHYKKSNLTTCDSFELVPQFVAQYENIFASAAAAAPAGDAPVVKLFEE
jgi:hypothetical protein